MRATIVIGIFALGTLMVLISGGIAQFMGDTSQIGTELLGQVGLAAGPAEDLAQEIGRAHV